MHFQHFACERMATVEERFDHGLLARTVWAPGAPRDRRFSGRTRADAPAQAAAAIAIGDRYTGTVPAATSAARPGKSDRVAAVRRRWRSHCA